MTKKYSELSTTAKEAIKADLSISGDHECRNDPEGMCRVTSAVSENLIFVANKQSPHCPYFVPFGYSGFCKWPIRKQIYKNYGI